MTVPGDPDPVAMIWDIIHGPRRFAALHALTLLGCARHLRRGPLTAAELAIRCAADPASLERLLRCAVTMRLLAITGPGRGYALTEAGRLLDPAAAGSLACAVLVTGNAPAWQAMLALDEAVRTGEPVFPRITGDTFWGWHESHPEARRAFQDLMTIRSAPVAAAMAGLDFGQARVIADIGGGYGAILAAVLVTHPRARGILLDRAEIMPEAGDYLAGTGVGRRCQFVSGDFFIQDAIPPADTYLLCNVLHDFSDQQVQVILANILSAASAGPRVLFCDMLLPDDLSPHIGFEQDMRRMAIDPGRERTRDEYVGLLRGAGLVITDLIPVGPMTIVDTRGDLPAMRADVATIRSHDNEH